MSVNGKEIGLGQAWRMANGEITIIYCRKNNSTTPNLVEWNITSGVTVGSDGRVLSADNPDNYGHIYDLVEFIAESNKKTHSTETKVVLQELLDEFEKIHVNQISPYNDSVIHSFVYEYKVRELIEKFIKL